LAELNNLKDGNGMMFRVQNLKHNIKLRYLDAFFGSRFVIGVG
jgi:hypothetical protein